MSKFILIQARTSSTRFPNKMLTKINGLRLIEYVYKRCKSSKFANDVIVITSDEKSDDKLFNVCLKNNIKVFRGDLDNVLKRYADATNFFNVNIIARVCGDSPFVDVEAIDKMFLSLEENKDLEYITTKDSLNGFMSEVFRGELIRKINKLSLSNEEKEHVTKYIRDNIENFYAKELDLNLKPKKLEKFTLTVDYPADILIVNEIANKLKDFYFTSKDVIRILEKMKDI